MIFHPQPDQGGRAMLNHEHLHEFVAMWRWLSAHPANDLGYYMKYVVKGSPAWMNNCPLSTREGKDCTDCRTLWNSRNGNLCADSDSPLHKWQETDMLQSDLRVYYASEVGALGVRAMSNLKAGNDILATA